MKSLSVIIKNILNKYFLNFFFNFFQQILRFGVLYLAAYKFGPYVFGTISIILLYNGYLLNSNLGAVNGLKRQIPLKYKQISKEEINKVCYSILIFNLASTIFFTFLVCCILFTLKILTKTNCVYLLSLSICNSLYFFSQTYIIANQLWKKLQLLQLLSTFCLIITGLVLWFFNKDFFFIFYSLSFLIPAIVILLKEINIAGFNFIYIKENVRIGFPIMIAGLVFFLFQTIDRLVIAKYYTKEVFGIYALATTLVSGFSLFTNLASEIILQKGINYILATRSNSSLRKYYLKITAGATISLIPILVAAYSFFVIIIKGYFPLYLDTLPIILNLIIAYWFQQLCIGFGNYYYIINAQSWYNTMLLIALIISFCIIGYPYFFKMDDTINILSRRVIFGSIIYSILIIAPAFFIKNDAFKDPKLVD